ncbi:MAG: flagellin [Desulfobulbaceae bacterium]|nr:flagellin [Desulfobulbaceae bacterium]HIJ89731.1 hypothetical protein [Deltaproteobacteria bacterium]
MRITMQSIHNNILGNLNKINTDMNRINSQISSGKQISKISENPVGLVTSLGLRSSITQITQYQSNLSFGDKTITAAENSLTQMKDIASRAKVLAIQLANGTMTPENRLSAAEEIQHLFESTITLSNTAVNGKYIFGGFRTTGYTDTEPTPFIQDARDGYFVNGGRMPDSSSTQLTGTIPNGAAGDITTGNLLINGVDVVDVLGADIDLTNAGVSGLNMTGAWNTAQAINDQKVISQTGVSDNLASPYAGVAATGTATDSRIAFYINGQFVDTDATDPLLSGDSAAQVAAKIVAAIQALPPATGITAEVGTGNNGGALNSIIIRNSTSGNTSPIEISGLNATEKTISGLTNNKATEGVTAKLTTLYAGAAATVPALPAPGDTTSVFFYLNGVPVNFSIDDNGTTTDAANATVTAINKISDRTGVTAVRGTDANGGVADSVVLYNTLAGNEANITITGYTETGASTTGLADIDQAIGNNNNTGTISLSSTASFEINTSAADDTILNLLGLGGGLKGFADDTGDGVLRYGSALTSGILDINGVAITTSADTLSDIYQDISAAAKAAAINNATSQSGVSATIVPVIITATRPVQAGTEETKLTGVVTNNTIAANDLHINGIDVAAINTGVVTSGLNTEKTYNAKEAINVISATTGVSASLTTLYAGAAADPGAATTAISFELNGTTVSVNATGTTATEIAQKTVAAINTKKELTGVIAVVGNGSNGGPSGAIVLRNTLAGDETPITLSGLAATETARIGLADTPAGGQIADANHNTGAITLSSATAFQLSSPNNLTDDSILAELGLGGGESNTGIPGDLAADGILEYGSTPISLNSGDLTINGINIFSKATAITSGDSSNALIDGINAKTEQTGVKAGRNNAGQIILSTVDGRNLHIQTSAIGEKVTQLNGGSAPQDQVYFGELRLWGANEFFINSDTTTVGAITNYETGFNAIGLAGGASASGQPADVADDGKIFVNTITYENGYVRYAGDRDNDFAVKIGQQSTIEVAKNGMSAIMDTGLFTVLKGLQDALRGQNYTTLTGGAKALDTSALLDSGKTGLPLEDELQNGSFTIVVNSHDTSPSRILSAVSINIDLAKDSLTDIANRINGVPGISASWSDDGHLQINSNDPERYTFALSNDTSNFLRVTGSETDNAQVSNINKSIGDLDNLMQNLTTQVSDFGARANRIIVQQQIYQNLELSTKANLSEQEDTDLTKALMEMKAKEIAYEAALSAAAKTMQLSLVDFLK